MSHQTPKIIEAPLAEPITVEEARSHLEAPAYNDSDVDPVDDTMIEGWLAAAREHCESFLGLSLSTRTLEIALDVFPTAKDIGGLAIDLPMGPVRDVLSVSWGDGSDEEMANDAFILDSYRRPNQLKPIDITWPVIVSATNAVKVRYLAGYGVDSDGGEPLPKAIRAAILLMLGHLYEHRGDEGDAVLPPAVQNLLRPLRVRLGMA